MKMAQRLASSVRIMWMKSSSTARRPSRPFTTIGKKQISATITSFGMIPKPSTMTRIGASTTIGIVWDPISSG